MKNRRRNSILTALILLGASCRREPGSGGISDSTFVAVMAELRRVHNTAGLDSAQRAARRTQILQTRNLTPAQLEVAAKLLAQNPTRAQTVWQAVEKRAADTTAAPGADIPRTVAPPGATPPGATPPAGTPAVATPKPGAPK